MDEATVPEFDAEAVGRVAERVQIQNVELLGAHFAREDDGPIPARAYSDEVPEIGLDGQWAFSDDDRTLGVILSFGTQAGEHGWTLVARFRLLYSVKSGEPLSPRDVELFVFWNAVFNGWPYWREYLSSTVNRAGLPRFLAPVLPVPRR